MVDGKRNVLVLELILSEYARMHNISYQKMITDMKKRRYITVEQRGSRWYIDETEPLNNVDHRKKVK